ncbi:endonuclease/exonuclease/phosphatase (EEP) superfamily protein YafD [Saccharopolyspora lacisalsi]|uniref:Endonuclease/exonuclease/phosphatase (EEP) superfamily protein YafD n=1 Tax=Halosaccharopolyspora lacisalsi TaxID=1000566 RepID=A0A839E5I6_9PSEU|nr:endonuclease/exonuclease/phosphatase family protein [Halosaccharopolyspora lacisalsi]MBA8826591.1 endonuclease/exonuclease/phosphatase (EEP) superfamily protein YafD [Halosaccharopolyspora lacisalsi]
MDDTIEMVETGTVTGRRRRSPGGGKVTAVLLVVAVPFLLWAALPLASFDGTRYTSALVALTPYAVPAGVVIAVAALLLRRWLITLVVGSVTALLVASVLPRAIPDSPVPVRGRSVTVMASNTLFGGADAGRIVELVRSHGVDVLALEELTPGMVEKLNRAGLGKVLPHRVFDAGPGGEGTGIASRYPLRELSLMRSTTMSQPSALVDLPGPRDVQFVAVHPMIPVGEGTVDTWEREIAALPDPAEGRRGPARVLAGDFNATLDHTPLRNLLGQGYSDAAEVTGDGFSPTWPMRGRSLVPPVTLDHVLTSGDIVTRGYRTFEIAGTDHRAVLAHLAVPS